MMMYKEGSLILKAGMWIWLYECLLACRYISGQIAKKIAKKIAKM